MSKQANTGGTISCANQPAPIHKKNAWWRQPKINQALRRYPYVISEGGVYFGRKAPGGKAWVWLNAEEMLQQDAANDEVFNKSEQ